MRKLYFRLCKWIGYVIVFRNYYDIRTFTLKKKNTHMALLKYIGKENEHGHVEVEQIFQIQIKKL